MAPKCILVHSVIFSSLLFIIVSGIEQEGEKQNVTKTATTSHLSDEVKIGFLVGSRRLEGDSSYARPGRPLVQAFQFALSLLNGATELNRTPTRSIKFVPVFRETFGRQTESVRQTVELIVREQVNVILGPQETCRLESELASVYKIAMISHYCNLKPAEIIQHKVINDNSFVEAKPSPVLMVARLMLLLEEQLLSANSCYPKSVILLYKIKSARADNGTASSMDPNEPSESWYELVGELLHTRLEQLILKLNKHKQEYSFSTLNWNTTFHYGYTRNPFRRLIRRHLFANSPPQHQSISGQLAAAAAATAAATAEAAAAKHQTKVTLNATSSSFKKNLYVIVGQYHEQLGLMLALNELNLLTPPKRKRANKSLRMSPKGDKCQSKLETSLVIGLDLEHYDETEDSTKFLRGLLLDARHTTKQQAPKSQSSANLNAGANNNQLDYLQRKGALSVENSLESLASAYTRYLAILPAIPARMAHFLQQLRNFDSITKFNNNNNIRQDNNNADSQTTNKILINLGSLMRMPIEAFYLYEATLQVGAYFRHCLLQQALALADCSDSRKIASWFKEAHFGALNNSCSGQNLQAQYTIVSSYNQRPIQADQLNSEQLNTDLDSLDQSMTLVRPIGSLQACQPKATLLINKTDLNPIWWPLFCNPDSSYNPQCQLNGSWPPNDELGSEQSEWSEQEEDDNDDDDETEYGYFEEEQSGLLIVLPIIIILILLSSALINRFYLAKDKYRLIDNSQWFSEQDEMNFLKIIRELLITQRESSDQMESGEQLVSLHCNMFSFPSCKFVHWLNALIQLKEMMFQFQSQNYFDTVANGDNFVAFGFIGKALRYLCLLKGGKLCANLHRSPKLMPANKMFFNTKHKQTGNIRLLMYKYKELNRVLIQLQELNNKNYFLPSLMAISIDFRNYQDEQQNGLTQLARLHLKTRINCRAHLRQTLAKLDQDLSCCEQRGKSIDGLQNEPFKWKLKLSLIGDLLQGLEFLHSSKMGFHGQLNATNCYINSHWRLILFGFHVHHLRRALGPYEPQNNATNEQISSADYGESLLYQSPEIDNFKLLTRDEMQLADIYSSGFLLFELLTFKEPWKFCLNVTQEEEKLTTNGGLELFKRVRARIRSDPDFRPPLNCINESSLQPVSSISIDLLRRLIQSCWSHSPERRPRNLRQLSIKLSLCLRYKLMDDQCQDEENKSSILSDYLSRLEKVSRRNRQLLEAQLTANLTLRMSELPLRMRINVGDKFEHLQRYKLVSLCAFRFTLKEEFQSESSDGDLAEDRIRFKHLNELFDRINLTLAQYHGFVHLMSKFQQITSEPPSVRFLAISGEPTYPKELYLNEKLCYHHVELMASFSLQLVELSSKMMQENSLIQSFRCACHCGPISASFNMRSDANSMKQDMGLNHRLLWIGKSLNLLDKLECESQSRRILISSDFKQQLAHCYKFSNRLENGRSDSSANYVMIKREKPIKMSFHHSEQSSTLHNSTGQVNVQRQHKQQRSMNVQASFCIETYWLLNGPRLSANQSLLLASASANF